MVLWVFNFASFNSLSSGRAWFFVSILILCSNVTRLISSGFVIISPVFGWFIHVGTCGLFLGPKILERNFQILAFGSVTLFSSIYSALRLSLSSLTISSKFFTWDCFLFLNFLWEMPLGLNLNPNAFMSISSLSRLSAVCLKSTSLCSSINFSMSGALSSEILRYLSQPRLPHI